MVKQYDIYYVNLDPTIGFEVKKIRPCVVVSPDELNKFLKTIIIAPITSSVRDYPTRLDIKLLNREGQVMVDQIRSIDKSRLLNKIGVLDVTSIVRFKAIIQEMLVD
jgi:mRNA interferase MazF